MKITAKGVQAAVNYRSKHRRSGRDFQHEARDNYVNYGRPAALPHVIRKMNWATGGGFTSAPIAWEPCAWDLMLGELKISERDALALIGTATPEWARIKAWVRANGYKLFAPEEILCALGMGE